MLIYAVALVAQNGGGAGSRARPLQRSLEVTSAALVFQLDAQPDAAPPLLVFVVEGTVPLETVVAEADACASNSAAVSAGDGVSSVTKNEIFGVDVSALIAYR